MSLLRTEPPAPVRSLDELFAIAEALEREAVTRYTGLAAQMRAAGQPAVAEVFEHLATVERSHAEQVEGWARTVTGHLPDPAWIRWQPPETFDEERPGRRRGAAQRGGRCGAADALRVKVVGPRPIALSPRKRGPINPAHPRLSPSPRQPCLAIPGQAPTPPSPPACRNSSLAAGR